MREESLLSGAVPDNAAKIVQHFTQPTFAEKALAELDEEIKAEAPETPLDFSSLCPELCAEILEAQERSEMWSDRLKMLKDQAKRLAGLERGALRFGDYILEVKESKGRTTTDWKAYVTATMTAKAVAEAQADPVYTKQGEPVISLSVKKLGAQK